MGKVGCGRGAGLSHAQQNEARCATSCFSLLTGFNLISSSSEVAVCELGFTAQCFLGNFEKLNKNDVNEQ